jgi:signal transduction histidine kinase
MKKVGRKIQSLFSQGSGKKIFEDKIFSIVNLISALMCFLTIVPNIYDNRYSHMNLAAGLIGITFFVFFYFSYFRRTTKPLILPFQILVALGLSLNWFSYQGIEGGTPFYFIPAIFAIIYADSGKKYWPILIVYIFLAVILVAGHYLNPEWSTPYPDENSRLRDLSFSFIVSLFMLGYGAIILKRNFDLERSKTEQKNKELHELNLTKDKFFTILSHDLKNPFNAIIGFSSILAEQVQEKNYEGIEEYARIVQGSSQRAMDLLINLMEWSRSQSGRMEFTPKNIEIVQLINEVSELTNDSALHKSITITKELPDRATIFADKAMIGTILRNLISNAIKFTNSGGRIVISAEQMDDELVVSVSDNGVGIKADSIEKLFRIEESYSTKGTQDEEGTGLGLLLCKEFILKHGGKIWAESKLHSGSTFYFTVPNE